MSASSQRDQVGRIAPTDLGAAAHLAATIADPWYRCQALACVAWHAASHKDFLTFVTRSVESSRAIVIPNRAVTVAAWPVAALSNRQFPDRSAMARNEAELRRIVPELLGVIAGEPNSASRADALLTLVHALSPNRPGLRTEVLGALRRACGMPENRKRQRQLEQAALVVAPDDPETALVIASSLDESRRRRMVERIESRWEGLGPREFFEPMR